MSNESAQPPRPKPNFSLAFKQMASFVAIAKTRATSEVLDELILQCYVVLTTEPLATPEQVAGAVRSLFGIQTNPKDVFLALSRLKKAEKLIDIGNGHLALAITVQQKLNSRIEAAKSLEQHVRENWLKQVHDSAPILDADALWETLLAYLQQAFRRHGIQAVELLNPEIDLGADSKVGLSSVLDGVISKNFPEKKPSSRTKRRSKFLSKRIN
jgi:hypothetical protein